MCVCVCVFYSWGGVLLWIVKIECIMSLLFFGFVSYDAYGCQWASLRGSEESGDRYFSKSKQYRTFTFTVERNLSCRGLF